ncbi:probable low affinity copper uptake protein 2 isoform X1 [Mya arenaria]|uniref:probable low affinity copper uptake protein 2 isoform X1 n=2 Tax=Mya arenaria TaxID=6604 RepID=UPI0022E5E71C|nr:probable low affinity copper uptake protein 2 isoform X1 [Mya arenaria]
MAFSYQSYDQSQTGLVMDIEMMKNMSMKMKDYFFLSADINHLFFEGWHFQGTGGVIGCCVMIFVLTILLEAGKAVIFYIQLRLKQNPLTYGRTGTTSIQDTRSSETSLFSSLQIPADLGQIKKLRIQYHISAYVLHTLNLLLGYLLMLAVMTFDAYIFIAVMLGSGVGYFVFGAVNARNRLLFTRLQTEVYTSPHNSQTGLTNASYTPPGNDANSRNSGDVTEIS